MIIKSCLTCKFHEIKPDGKDEMSHCQKENCWSRYSKCVLAKALEKYLKEESSQPERSFSALTHVYSQE
jgi:hypothetical protein